MSLKNFTVKTLADLSGVSVRTLHHYDHIGLLRPTTRTDKKYRLYGEKELLRLQQILFFRELGFALNEILELLDEPDYDLMKALMRHKSALLKRKKRIATLLKTIDTTIINLKQGEIMKNPKALYQGFPKEIGTTYRKEAVEKYGKKTIERSEKELMKLGKTGFDALLQESKQIYDALFELRHEDAECDNVQQVIARHYEIIRKFWGTSNSTDKQAQAYSGLGDLYVNDERFLTNASPGTPQPEFAQFLQKAMHFFALNKLA